MATAIVPFRKLQAGIETTKGTLVAATRVLVGEGWIQEEQDFYRSPYPRGLRANVGAAGVITRKGMLLDWNSELTFEEVLWPLLLGVRGGVTGVAGGGGDAATYTYTFTPQLTTGVPTLDAATLEYMLGDGVTNQYARECGYAMVSEFGFDWAFNQVAKMNVKLFARAAQVTTPTAALTEYSGREPAVTNLLKVYRDTTWAGLGGTQQTGIVRSAKLVVSTGLGPDYTMDGRADLDFVRHLVGILSAKLSLVLELDATAASRFGEYRSNSIEYIRLQQVGTTVPGGTSQKTVQVDGAYRFVSPPSFSADGEQVLMNAELESVYDDTGTKTLEFVVKNALSAVA